MRTHTIRTNQIAAGRYAVTGAVPFYRLRRPSETPRSRSATAGHPESDLIAVASGDCTFVPQTIGAILRPRPAPPKFNPSTQAWVER